MKVKIGDKVKLIKHFTDFYINKYIEDQTQHSFEYVYFKNRITLPIIFNNYEEEVIEIDSVNGKNLIHTESFIVNFAEAIDKGEIEVNARFTTDNKTRKLYRRLAEELVETFDSFKIRLICENEMINYTLRSFLELVPMVYYKKSLQIKNKEAEQQSKLNDEDFFKEIWERKFPQPYPHVINQEFESFVMSWHYPKDKVVIKDGYGSFVKGARENNIHKFTRIEIHITGIYLSRNRYDKEGLIVRPFIHLMRVNSNEGISSYDIHFYEESAERVTFNTPKPWKSERFQSLIQKLIESPVC